MARSGSTDYSISTTNIIQDALTVAGVLRPGQTMNNEQSAQSLRTLNLMIKTWMGGNNPIMRGLKMWQRATATLDPPAAGISYEIKPTGGDLDLAVPVEILTMTVKNTNNIETSLAPMTLEDYQAVSDKSSGSTGTPTKFYYERQYDKGVVYFDVYLSSTAAGYTFPFTYLRILQDVDAVTDDVDFPQEYYEAIKYNLAIRLAPEFHKPVTKEAAYLATLTLEQANKFHPDLYLPEDMYFQPGRDD